MVKDTSESLVRVSRNLRTPNTLCQMKGLKKCVCELVKPKIVQGSLQSTLELKKIEFTKTFCSISLLYIKLKTFQTQTEKGMNLT